MYSFLGIIRLTSYEEGLGTAGSMEVLNLTRCRVFKMIFLLAQPLFCLVVAHMVSFAFQYPRGTSFNSSYENVYIALIWYLEGVRFCDWVWVVLHYRDLIL